MFNFFSHQTVLYTYLLIPWFSLSFHYIRILHIHSDESGDNLPSLFKKRGLDPPRLHVGKISCLSFFSIDERDFCREASSSPTYRCRNRFFPYFKIGLCWNLYSIQTHNYLQNFEVLHALAVQNSIFYGKEIFTP